MNWRKPSVKTGVTLELRPIPLPTVMANPLCADEPAIRVALCDLEADAIERLCDDLKERMLSAAGKQASPSLGCEQCGRALA